MEDHKKHTVSFSMKYPTEFGQDLYVLGSIPELGNWHNFKAKLKWHEGHIWSGTFVVSHASFQYKYVVYNSKTKQIIWEAGRNRQCEFKDAPAISLDDVWESYRVHFMIYYPLPEGTIMRINGDLDSMGHWNLYGPKTMALSPEDRVLPNGGKGRAWEFEVLVPIKIESIGYKYSTFNEKTQIAVWEREPTRILKIPEKIAYEEVLSIKQEKGLADFTQVEIPINGRIEKWDVNFVSSINFDKIGMYPIFIGAYPQHEEDVEILSKNGVTGVLNVQTEIDMKHRQVNWLKMKEIYAKHGIKGVNFPIHDFNPVDLAEKIKDAAKVLNDLINEDRTVYVHCTAGMGRAPASVIGYLVTYKGVELQEAYDLVKEYRKVANPNMSSLKKALLTPMEAEKTEPKLFELEK